MRVEHGLAAVGRADADPAPARTGDRVALDAQSDRAIDGDAVPLRARESAVGDRNACAHSGRADDAGADQDIGQRRPVDRQVAQRHLVAADEDAVHPRRLRHGDTQPADAHARGDRCADVRMRQVEERVREVGMLRVRVEARGPEAERDDAGPVRADRRVVVGEPEAARAVAGPVRELRQEDRATRVELGLQQVGVVAHGGARGRAEPEQHGAEHQK